MFICEVFDFYKNSSSMTLVVVAVVGAGECAREASLESREPGNSPLSLRLRGKRAQTSLEGLTDFTSPRAKQHALDASATISIQLKRADAWRAEGERVARRQTAVDRNKLSQ